MTDILDNLVRELEAVKIVRDDLKNRLEHAKGDAKEEWHRLEERLTKVEEEARALRESAKQPATELAEATRGVMQELKEGYQRIRADLLD